MQLNAQWQFDPSLHTEVDVCFTAVDERATRVDIDHRGLEAYRADALTMRDAFGPPNGWNGMLESLRHVAGTTSGPAPTRRGDVAHHCRVPNDEDRR